jgi:hypothetical protein
MATDEVEVVTEFKHSLREFDHVIEEELLSWLNSYEALDASVKKQVLARLVGLRVKFQVLMVEVQKKIFRDFVQDLQTESVARDYLRSQLPYLSNKERIETITALAKIDETRLQRLETQLTGWDFVNTTAMSLETLSEIRASEELVDEVKKLAPERRARLLLTANEIIKEINTIEKAESTDV